MIVTTNGLESNNDQSSELKVFNFNSRVSPGTSHKFRVTCGQFLVVSDVTDYTGNQKKLTVAQLAKLNNGVPRYDIITTSTANGVQSYKVNIATFDEFESLLKSKAKSTQIPESKRPVLTEMATTFFDELYAFLGISRSKEIADDANREFRVCTPTQPQTNKDKIRTALAESGAPAHYINKLMEGNTIMIGVHQEPSLGPFGWEQDRRSVVALRLEKDENEEEQPQRPDLHNQPNLLYNTVLHPDLLRKFKPRNGKAQGAYSYMPLNVAQKLMPEVHGFQRVTNKATERKEQVWYENNSVHIMYVWAGAYSTRFDWDYEIDYAATGRLDRVVHVTGRKVYHPTQFAELYPAYMKDFLRGRNLNELLHNPSN
jgi:hypothetical protein